MVETLLAAFFALFAARMPAPVRRCVEHRQSTIAGLVAGAAAFSGVPAGLVLAVGYLESRWGCDPRSGGGWGAQVNGPGTVYTAANSLATSYRVCGDWFGAVSRFRCGRCECPASWYALSEAQRGYVPGDAFKLVARATGSAELARGLPPPR